MKTTLLSFCLLFIAVTANSQINFDAIPDDAYEEIPAISKKFNVEENGMKCGKAIFQYYPEYEYKKSISFGTVCRIVMDELEGLQETADGTFAMARHEMRRKSDGQVMVAEEWKFVNEGAPFSNEGGASEYVDFPFYIGRPMYSGEYEIEMEIKDFCSGNTVKASIVIAVGQNEAITATAKGGASFSEVFLFSVSQGAIVLDGKAKIGQFKMLVDNIEGFTVVDGYYSIGLELKLTSIKGEELLHLEDAASENGGAIKKDGPFMLDPYTDLSREVLGEEITFFIRIWDKKGKGEITAETTFKVVE